MASLPAPRRWLERLIAVKLGGSSTVPPQIPLLNGLALAAAAEAHDRGVRNAKRIYDLVRRMDLDDAQMLVVCHARGRPTLVAADTHTTFPAVVIELSPLAERVGRARR
jgi:hypothetical protein